MGAMERRWDWPQIRPSQALQLWALFAVGALVQASGLQQSLSVPFPGLHLMFLVGATSGWLSFPFVIAAVVYAPDPARSPVRFVLVHGVGHGLYALGSAVLSRPLIELAYRAGGVTAELPTLGDNVLFQSQNTLPLYAGMVALTTIYLTTKEREQLGLRAAQHERAIAQEQLGARESRIDTHSVLRALAHIDSLLLRQGVAAAEARLQRLADELRVRLADSHRATEKRTPPQPGEPATPGPEARADVSPPHPP